MRNCRCRKTWLDSIETGETGERDRGGARSVARPSRARRKRPHHGVCHHTPCKGGDGATGRRGGGGGWGDWATERRATERIGRLGDCVTGRRGSGALGRWGEERRKERGGGEGGESGGGERGWQGVVTSEAHATTASGCGNSGADATGRTTSPASDARPIAGESRCACVSLSGEGIQRMLCTIHR